MSYNTKNYMTKDAWVLKDVNFGEGLVKNIADSDATTIALLKADFNALLKALKDCGLMEADEEVPAI